MKTSGVHIELHVSKPDATLPFYRDLLGYFGWPSLMDAPGALGMGDTSFSVWLFQTAPGNDRPLDRDSTGIGHIGLKVDSAEQVDEFVREYMTPRGIEPAFDTPRARPDFGGNYYQVMFVDPEGLAIEVFHA